MPPHGLPAAAEPSQAAAALGNLPDDVLVSCLALLSQEDRFKNVAPVSRRFHALCLHPQLLRRIDCQLQQPPGGADQSLAKLSALCGLLEGHGEHVQHLSMHRASPETGEQLACCLSRVPATLQTLSVEGRLPTASIMIWLPRLTALRTLRLSHSEGALHLPAGFSRLTQLAEADLGGTPVAFEGSCLPGSITRLCITSHWDEQMPQQLSTLTNLAQLKLCCTCYAPNSMAPLTACTALRYLRLHASQTLPACLPLLTQLERLAATWVSLPAAATSLCAALPALTRLTFLALYGAAERLLPDVGAAQHIQSLGLQMFGSRRDPPPPAGPWLARICWLGMRWERLAAFSEALRMAPQLHHLCCMGLPEEGPDRARWRAFWELVATHPPLRCLEVQALPLDDAPSPALRGALTELAARRPGLRLLHSQCISSTSSWEEMISGAGHA